MASSDGVEVEVLMIGASRAGENEIQIIVYFTL